jgi:hypothetical protein
LGVAVGRTALGVAAVVGEVGVPGAEDVVAGGGDPEQPIASVARATVAISGERLTWPA